MHFPGDVRIAVWPRPESFNGIDESNSNLCKENNINPNEDDYPLSLILGSVTGVLVVLLAIVLSVVLIKKRRVAKLNRRRNSKDENPIYGPRETVYVDEVFLTHTSFSVLTDPSFLMIYQCI